MAAKFLNVLQNLWPVSLFKYDDLRASDELVLGLSVPESTKRFVFAVRVPEYESVIYILATQSLSERSAADAECLIREIRPDAVVAQVGDLSFTEIQPEESGLGDSLNSLVPTSSAEVLRRCFFDKFNKEKYENMAGNLVLREIFGTSFHGHLLAAERVTKEIGSSFMLLESSLVKTCAASDSSGNIETGRKIHGLVSSFVPQNVGPAALSSCRRYLVLDDIQLRMVESLSSHMQALDSKLRPSASLPDVGVKETRPAENDEVPSFAKPIFPLLVDLHNIFSNLPLIGRALENARKMLCNVDRGEAVAPETISEVYAFRVAVEGLRIALNNAGRLSLKELGNPSPDKADFPQLQFEDKSNALLAQALRGQGKNFKTIVAIVDTSSLAGIRKHWNTPVPPDVKDLVGDLVTTFDSDESNSSHSKLKRLLSDKPVVAVSAGATAVLGASSLSKIVPASTIMKVASFKIPAASLKLFLTQSQKVMTFALSKALGPSKVVVPGLASSGPKTSSLLKAAASAEKIRAITHSMIASVEKTSFSAMRSAFYEIMRKRRVRPIGFLPWATLGCSVATCTGLVMYGDGIECVAESLPSAPSIASLGRGIQSLHAASQAASQTDGNRVQKAIESLIYRLKKV